MLRPREGKEYRRRQILSAAAKAFAEKGYHGTTIEEISETVELAKGTIYLYFASKEALFLAVIEDGVYRMVELIDEAANRPGGIQERLTTLLNAMLIFHWENPDFFRFFIREASVIEGNSQDDLRKKCYRLQETLLSHLNRIMEQGIQRAELRKTEPSTLSTLFLAIVHALSYRSLRNATRPAFASSAPLIVDCFLRGVQARV